MKKTKVYRPRRGVRFSNGRLGTNPAANFIGGPSISKTFPTIAKVNWATKKFTLVSPSGSVMRAVQSNTASLSFARNALGTPVVTTSSISIEGSISFGRQYEKRKYNAILLGQASSAPVGALPFSDVVQDASPTGSFVSPSWTHSSVGFNQAFVGMSLTSSFVETKSLNYFLSGNAPVESSPVPASSSLFYSKESRYRTIIVKHTASFFDTVVGASGTTVPSTFAAGTGCLINTITGSNIAATNCCPDLPATIRIDVPVSGRLVDIKVWLELIHVSSSTKFFPLGTLTISLRNPNLRWGSAHPLRNDPEYIAAARDALFAPFSNTCELLRDAFLLWDGPGGYACATGPNSGHFLSGTDDMARYPSWQKDRCMRTIFSDGSTTPNPRHFYSSSPSGNYVGSPNSGLGTPQNTAYGNDVPWTSDATVFPYNGTYQAAGSPPKGWLSGPGGAADTNEWPTTGSNFGAETIKPFYPLLDPIYGKKIVNDPLGYIIGSNGYPIYPTHWRGFRPGLRGTEISGTWKIMISNNLVNQAATSSMDTYFRQARLEITYETPSWSRPTQIRRSETRRQPRRAAPILLSTISGTDSPTTYLGVFFTDQRETVQGSGLDYFVTEIYSDAPSSCEIGRTFGVQMNTGSFLDTSSALLYRLSGTLSRLSGSAPAWLTNNQFGMPLIPDSSASLSPRIVQPISTASPASVISPSKALDGPRKLSDVVRVVNPAKSVVELAADFVSGALS